MKFNNVLHWCCIRIYTWLLVFLPLSLQPQVSIRYHFQLAFSLCLKTFPFPVQSSIFGMVTCKWLFVIALPVGEYAAVALLTFFGLSSIKNAWALPSATSKDNKESTELGELVEAEELVKKKVSRKET